MCIERIARAPNAHTDTCKHIRTRKACARTPIFQHVSERPCAFTLACTHATFAHLERPSIQLGEIVHMFVNVTVNRIDLNRLEALDRL
jgi:hypothetical protein